MSKIPSEESINLGYNSSDKGDQRTEKSETQIVSAKFIPVRCSWVEKPRILRVHHSRGEIEINIQKFMNRRSVKKFSSNYDEGDLCYITYFRLRSGEENENYIYGVYDSKEKAMNSKLRIRSAVDLYNRIQYSELETKDVIEFGMKNRIVNNNEKVSSLYGFIERIRSTPILVTSILVLGYIASQSTTIVGFFSITIMLFSVLAFVFTTWIDINTYTSLRIRDVSIPQRNFDNRNQVVLANVEENNNQVKITPCEINTCWTFKKNDFGDICGYEKDVLKEIDTVGKENKRAILRIQSSLKDDSGLRSDDGRYILPKFERKLNIDKV
jgi:hypothetical protein